MKSNAITNKHHVEDSGAINLCLRKVSRPQTCRFRHRYNRKIIMWKIITCPDKSPFVRWRGKLAICPFFYQVKVRVMSIFSSISWPEIKKYTLQWIKIAPCAQTFCATGLCSMSSVRWRDVQVCDFHFYDQLLWDQSHVWCSSLSLYKSFFVMWLEKHDRSANIQHTPHRGSSPSSSLCCSRGTAPRNSVKHTAAATLATAGTFADCNQMLSFSSAPGKLLMLISRSGWNAAGAGALAPKQGWH